MSDIVVDGNHYAECVKKWPIAGGENLGELSWCKYNENVAYSKVSQH